MTTFPRWAQQLLDRHPGASAPTAQEPTPAWLLDELRQTPLWYIIREAQEVRRQHPFLVFDEIEREPDQWQEILDRMAVDVGRVADLIKERGIERVLFTGCGSAFFTAIHGAFTWERHTPLEATAVESYELENYFPRVTPDRTMLIAHSGTGGSIETVEAVRAAKEKGLFTLALTNTDVSPILDECDEALVYLTRQGCGPCISVVSTRALVQTMLARDLAASEASAISLDRSLRALPQAGRQFLEEFTDRIRGFAERTVDVQSVFLVGSGPNYFTAREGTLKIEEQSLIVGKAYRTGDFHHDALSLLRPTRLVGAIAAAGRANRRVVDVLRAARAAGSPTLAIEYGSVEGLESYADDVWHLHGEVEEDVAPVLLTLPFQLLGYFMGVSRGSNPDTLATDHESNTRAWLTSFPLGTH
ncbi:MAG: SIS domain-containing protein [Gaiellaceae bacterium]